MMYFTSHNTCTLYTRRTHRPPPEPQRTVNTKCVHGKEDKSEEKKNTLTMHDIKSVLSLRSYFLLLMAFYSSFLFVFILWHLFSLSQCAAELELFRFIITRISIQERFQHSTQLRNHRTVMDKIVDRCVEIIIRRKTALKNSCWTWYMAKWSGNKAAKYDSRRKPKVRKHHAYIACFTHKWKCISKVSNV